MTDTQSDAARAHAPTSGRGPLAEIAWLFLRLGATSFGGPAAHIAMLRDECVHRRRWVSDAEFLDLLGAVNLIPGPNSTELAIHLGHRRGGWPGLVVAGVCFILPAVLIVWGLAWLYVEYQALPPVAAVLYVVKPVMLAVVAQALVKLTPTAVRSVPLGAIAVVAAVALFLGVNELVVLFGAGLVVVAVERIGVRHPPAAILLLMGAGPPAATAAASTLGLGSLFLFFAKVGSVLFGSGYVLLAFLRSDLVERWEWLTEAELLDAVAVGQVTPGPVFTTATFVGYLLLGSAGALVATAGIFLPAFVFVALSGPLVPRLRKSRAAGAFLDGLNVASLALMAVVTWHLGASALLDWQRWATTGLAAVLLLRYGVNSAWLMLGAAGVGLAAAALGWL